MVIKGYLKMIDGVPCVVTPNGTVELDFNPPPKMIDHIVFYNEETKEIIKES